jgi:transposase
LAVKKYLAKHNVMALTHPLYSPDLSPPTSFCSATKCVLKRQRFTTLEEVIEKATTALTGTKKNGFQECFQIF